MGDISSSISSSLFSLCLTLNENPIIKFQSSSNVSATIAGLVNFRNLLCFSVDFIFVVVVLMVDFMRMEFLEIKIEI